MRHPGDTLRRLRELERLTIGAVVLADSAPEPRYFRRWYGGWLACSPTGNTRLHDRMHAELAGWPLVLPLADIRRPVVVVAVPEPRGAVA